MSQWSSVYLGPYAEWFVKPGAKLSADLKELIEGALAPNMAISDPPTIKVGRVSRWQVCYRPSGERPGGPSRQMSWGGQPIDADVTDLSTVKIQEEMDWFSQAYAAELRALAEYYKKPPRICWGVISMVS
jgi:hypothetical protein